MNPVPQPSKIAQKVELTYKLFLLENARETLEHELRNFVNKSYEEVEGFLNSSLLTSTFGDLANSLDMKCQALDKLSAILKNLTIERQVCVQPAVMNGKRTNQLQPLRQKGTLKTDVLKFGPMLQNVLIASSIAKAVQVLGATLSLKQWKRFLISQPTVVQDDMICSNTSSYNRPTQTINLPCHLKAEQKEQVVIFKDQCQPDAVILTPAIVHRLKIDIERPPLFLPPLQAILPEISHPKPIQVTTQISPGKVDDVGVQHQKQISSQLLHFLTAKAKNMGALKVTVMEWSKSICTSASSEQTSPTIKTQSYQFRHVNDDLINALATETLCPYTEDQSPVFRLKRKESSGFLTYTCVIATETELWDIGDIPTDVGQDDFKNSPLEKRDYHNGQKEHSCLNIQIKNTTVNCTEPETENNSVPVIKSVNIPEFQSQRFKETEVVVSHIVSPGNFYIQHADATMKLQALSVECRKATSSYALQNCIPGIGTQVMGWFPKQEQWCRAQVEVKRLDYGDTACLSLLDIIELTPYMAVLPLQAIQVSLANVMPVNESDWSEEAVGWFKAVVHNRTLYARLYPQGPKVAVELFLEKGNLGAMRRSAPLSLRLAQNGHAKHNKLKNVGLMKRSTVKRNAREEDWKKYLISHYAQNKK
ncbi:hypothetical protein Q5P01_009155 [Channa striata]|uniref:Tudor domain-containing protein n=1 Tax=Channa striata TaxID=64152 RepID=A0AA88N0N8_CHASR|nr:hypothetical protein Q5P01_009155 [Channa striata]